MSEPWVVDMMRATIRRKPVPGLPAPSHMPTLPAPSKPVERDWIDLDAIETDWPLKPPKGFRITRDGNIEPKLTNIMLVVSEETQVSVREMCGQDRARRIVRARHMYCFCAKRLTSKSYPAIGGTLGDRDHSTILSSVRRVTRFRDEFEPVLSRVLARLEVRG